MSAAGPPLSPGRTPNLSLVCPCQPLGGSPVGANSTSGWGHLTPPPSSGHLQKGHSTSSSVNAFQPLNAPNLDLTGVQKGPGAGAVGDPRMWLIDLLVLAALLVGWTQGTH